MKMSIEEREQWKDNWTYDPKTNKMNSSSLFDELIEDVSSIIKASSFDLLHGRVESVARLIMAQLAHVHGLSPQQTNIDKKTIQILIIASREYLHHDGMCDRQNKMSDEYIEKLKDAIGKAYKFVTGNEWEDGT